MMERAVNNEWFILQSSSEKLIVRAERASILATTPCPRTIASERGTEDPDSWAVE